MRLDHLVLTVKDIDKTVDFYTSLMGFEKEVFGANRCALQFEQGKINLHEYGNEFEPKADVPTPGSADLCFITEENIESFMDKMSKLNVTLEEGPIQRTGSQGPILSVYFRDPDNNLIEVSNSI